MNCGSKQALFALRLLVVDRYMHSPVEVVSLKDLEMIPQLMAGFGQALKKGEQFKVKI